MPPRILWEPDLVEEAVFLELRRRAEAGDPAPERLHREALDALYRSAPSREREATFREAARKAFTSLGLGLPAERALEGFPRLSERVERIVVIRVPHPREEVADLSPDRSQAGIRLTVGRLLGGEALRRILRHELMHLEDLLDPAFAFSPGERFGGSPARKRLREDRYRESWAASVDARLGADGLHPEAEHWGRFRPLFGSLPEEDARARFQAVLSRRPTHPELLEMADLGGPDAAEPSPGGACPLCQFPTFAWAKASDLERISERVRGEYPDWSVRQGLCGRCAERWLMVAA